jgi:flagellar protein FlgJ
MNGIPGIAGNMAGNGATSERERLQHAMRQLEGVFVQQLFKAMRETVPDEGIASGGSGEQIFTSMLDEQMAAEAPTAWHDGNLEAALLRQFRSELQSGDTGGAAR